MKRLIVATIALILGGTSCAREGAKFTSQSNAAFAKTIATQGVQVVDVRSPYEYADGHIPGAQNIDLNSLDFAAKVAAKLDKSNPVAVYCRSGGRSKAAAGKLADNGYTVYELDHGLMCWNGKTEK